MWGGVFSPYTQGLVYDDSNNAWVYAWDGYENPYLLTPIMTSNTTPNTAGYVISSTPSSAGTEGYHAFEQDFNIRDGGYAYSYFVKSSGNKPFIGYIFNEKKLISYITLYVNSGSGSKATYNCNIEITQDGVSWESIDTFRIERRATRGSEYIVYNNVDTVVYDSNGNIVYPFTASIKQKALGIRIIETSSTLDLNLVTHEFLIYGK